MGIFILVIISAAIIYFIYIKYGNLSFWSKAAKNPDFVYQYLLKDDAWIIDDGLSNMDKNEFDGPFSLYIPSIDKTIKFYGKVGEYEDSQKKLEEKLSNL